jgi:integrase
VFSTTGTAPPSGFLKAKHRLDQRMAELLGSRWDAKAEEFVGGKFKPWRVHDLRRTCATGMENLGVDTRVVETALHFQHCDCFVMRHADAETCPASTVWARLPWFCMQNSP